MSLQMRNNTLLQPCNTRYTSSYGKERICSRGEQCKRIFGCNPRFYGEGVTVASDYRLQLTDPARGAGSDSVPSTISNIWSQTLRRQHSNKINPWKAFRNSMAMESRSDAVEREYGIFLPGSGPKSNFHGWGNARLRANMERLEAISSELVGTKQGRIFATFVIEADHSLPQTSMITGTCLPYRASSAALLTIHGPLSQFICTGAIQ